jgi:glutathione S-transferase
LKGGEQKTEAFLKKNIHGKIPVLEDGDLFINESVSICRYICYAKGGKD